MSKKDIDNIPFHKMINTLVDDNLMDELRDKFFIINIRIN